MSNIPLKQLGSTSIYASRIGLGCMGMTSFYKSDEMKDE